MYQTTFSLLKWLKRGKEWGFWGVLIALVSLFWGVSGILTPVYADQLVNDGFENYQTGNFYGGVNNWENMTDAVITEVKSRSGIKAMKTYGGFSNWSGLVSSGTISLWISGNLGQFMLWDQNNAYCSSVLYSQEGNDVVVRYLDDGQNEFLTSWTADDNWHNVQFNFSSASFFNISADGVSVNVASQCGGNELNKLYVASFENYLDDFGVPFFVSPLIYGVLPESGTEITDLNSNITVGYEGLGEYDSVYITLRHPPTGLFTEAKVYKIDEIGESGELVINLQDFNIEKNGNWYLHAVAVYEGYQVEGGMFLSGYGWIWSGDLTDGDYYLDVNIEGFDEIFAMSDFNSWYDENSKFDEPTAVFNAITGFFAPIFSTVGEFGSRIQNYFDTNTAYAKGESIGRAIPFFAYYVEQVAVFMGGFPLMNWLLIIILLLVGIFVFRIIMKFIPFLG